MHNDTTQVRGTEAALLERGAARWWWAPLVAGLVWFVIGWLVLRANYTSLAAVGVLVGVVFLIAAVSEGGLAAVMTGGWKAMHIALAVIFVLGAIWAFVRPVNTFFALASMLGLILFIQGFFYLAQGIALRDVSPYWWIEVVSGGLIVLLALWISTSDRVWTVAARSAFILLWVGFMAVFRGIRDIVLAFELRRMGQHVEARLREAEAPFIPAQERRTAADAPRERQP
jgi:uncharacterized membrane protein HdeD (DUF308 family)